MKNDKLKMKDPDLSSSPMARQFFIFNFSFMQYHRSRLPYAMAMVVIIPCGLLSRSELIPLPISVAKYAGDTLWALLVFMGICVCLPRRRTREIALAALLFSFAVEFSQFYQAPWIDGLRQTRLGGLMLGFGFKASDLLCYALGIILGTLIDPLLARRTRDATRSFRSAKSGSRKSGQWPAIK